MDLFFKSLKTDSNDVSSLILRVTLWVVMLAHGLQKLGFLKWSDAWIMESIAWTIMSFEQYFGIPPFITVLVILWETIWALMLIAWAWTRFSAWATLIIMIGAALLAHLDAGFFINWMWAEGKWNGIEMHLLTFAMAIALMINGWWKASLDSVIQK